MAKTLDELYSEHKEAARLEEETTVEFARALWSALEKVVPGIAVFTTLKDDERVIRVVAAECRNKIPLGMVLDELFNGPALPGRRRAFRFESDISLTPEEAEKVRKAIRKEGGTKEAET